MRIIDKNTDFYDYFQGIYPDNSLTFDRRSSFVLTKEMICSYLYSARNRRRFLLLQSCNTFWLFYVEITKKDGYGNPSNFEVQLLRTWKNYNKSRVLLKLDVISFSPTFDMFIKNRKHNWIGTDIDKETSIKNADTLVKEINTNNYRVESSIDNHVYYVGDPYGLHTNMKRVEKNIPLLKASGLASYIDPFDLYLSIEEYLSLEKTSSERTESIGITDTEKIENHGFDAKVSFRGK